MVVIAVCDDEKEMRVQLAGSVRRQMELMGASCRIMEFSGGEQLLGKLREKPGGIDIIFLDIELGTENGVETAGKIRKEDRDCMIVFVTGYSEYVFHGYEVGALNYILKPYKEQKIKSVLEEALLRLEKKKERFFSVTIDGSLYRLPFGEILYFTSRLRKVAAVTEGKEWEYYGKLSDMEKQVPQTFVRIHQRYLVNMAYVERVDRDSLLLKGERLPISRQHYQETAGAFARLLIEE